MQTFWSHHSNKPLVYFYLIILMYKRIWVSKLNIGIFWKCRLTSDYRCILGAVRSGLVQAQKSLTWLNFGSVRSIIYGSWRSMGLVLGPRSATLLVKRVEFYFRRAKIVKNLKFKFRPKIRIEPTIHIKVRNSYQSLKFTTKAKI